MVLYGLGQEFLSFDDVLAAKLCKQHFSLLSFFDPLLIYSLSLKTSTT